MSLTQTLGTAAASGLSSPSIEEIEAVGKLVKDLCGIDLDTSKGYLIESRLGPLVKQNQLSSYLQLVQKARDFTSEQLRQAIVDAITIQETLFFRDSSPFDALRYKAIPETIDAKAKSLHSRRLRFWSAAASTGQEAYSIAIVLHELIPDITKWDVQIVATDISNSAIAKASRGIFSDLDVERGLSNDLKRKYFHKVAVGWQLSDSVRSIVSFRQLNLLKPFPTMGPFDIVFCRNVAIYFEVPQRIDLFQRIRKMMTPEGYLFVGGSETLVNYGNEFKPHAHCRATYYRPNLPQ